MFPDLLVFGVAFERLAARLTGAGPDHDLHQVADMQIHLDTFEEHRRGAQMARERGDLHSAFIEEADAAVNAFFAIIVASRIVDPAIREQAFTELNARAVYG